MQQYVTILAAKASNMEIISFLSHVFIKQIISVWAYYVPGTVPSTGDTDSCKSSRRTVQRNKSQCKKAMFPNLVSEKFGGRCFSKEMFQSQLILKILGKKQVAGFFPELFLRTLNAQMCIIHM
jgi:hypothetical protein